PEILSLRNGGEFFSDDRRTLIDDDHADEASSDRAILPFGQWKERVGSGSTPSFIWLAPADDFTRLQSAVHSFRLIALRFPSASDGRAYSIASVLRTHYGYRGELRAIGEVQIDQLFFLRRVGFDSAQLRPELSTAATLPTIRAALATFSERYQGAVDQPLPLFKRRLLGEVLT
ncbi:MAG: DUF934 domain-containing protein, partial [Burkholderiaceae bacterium]